MIRGHARLNSMASNDREIERRLEVAIFYKVGMDLEILSSKTNAAIYSTCARSVLILTEEITGYVLENEFEEFIYEKTRVVSRSMIREALDNSLK